MADRRFKFGLWFHHRNEGAGPWWLTAEWIWWPTVFGRYLGTIAKGWWYLGWDSMNRYFEASIAVGGEDNMVQLQLVVPFVARFAIGVRVPRFLTSWWIYQRREFGIRVGFVGASIELLLAYDWDGSDMAAYYRRSRERGEPQVWTRLAHWPGYTPTLRLRPIDWLLGRSKCEAVESDPTPVTVPMPERTYAGHLVRTDRTWRRPRWPWPIRKRTSYWVALEDGIPIPGKGENSWDCGEDAVRGAGGATPGKAIAALVAHAFERRERYGGGLDWTSSEQAG